MMISMTLLNNMILAVAISRISIKMNWSNPVKLKCIQKKVEPHKIDSLFSKKL